MGGPWGKLHTHRRSWALSAALILPLSSAAVDTATPGAGAAPAPRTTALSPAKPNPARSFAPPREAKIAPLDTSSATGRSPVVEGTLKERVRRVSAMSSYDVPLAALRAYRAAAASEPGRAG